METKFYLLIILVGLLIIFGLSTMFSSFKTDEIIDEMYLSICDPDKTYYSVSNANNIDDPGMGLTMYGNEKECEDLCSYSDKCVGYLSDSNNICYFFEDKDIDEHTKIQYECKFPVKKFYGKLTNTDAWRHGRWKSDYPFKIDAFTRLNNGFWDLCNSKPTYWSSNKSLHNTENITVSNVEECNQTCINRKEGCLGWHFQPKDFGNHNYCKLYNNVNNMKIGDFDYECTNPKDDISGFLEGAWKASVVPPEYIRKK